MVAVVLTGLRTSGTFLVTAIEARLFLPGLGSRLFDSWGSGLFGSGLLHARLLVARLLRSGLFRSGLLGSLARLGITRRLP